MKTIQVLSIDPGTHKVGLALFEVSYGDRSPKGVYWRQRVVGFSLLKARKTDHAEKRVADLCTQLEVAINSIKGRQHVYESLTTFPNSAEGIYVIMEKPAPRAYAGRNLRGLTAVYMAYGAFISRLAMLGIPPENIKYMTPSSWTHKNTYGQGKPAHLRNAEYLMRDAISNEKHHWGDTELKEDSADAVCMGNEYTLLNGPLHNQFMYENDVTEYKPKKG